MRRGLDLGIDEIQAEASLTYAIRLATILTIRSAFVAFQMTFSARQTASANAFRFVRRGRRLWRVAIGLWHSHQTDLAVLALVALAYGLLLRGATEIE